MTSTNLGRLCIDPTSSTFAPGLPAMDYTNNVYTRAVAAIAYADVGERDTIRLYSGASAYAAYATLSANAPATGATITFTSNDPSVVQVAPSVTAIAGANSVDVPLYYLPTTRSGNVTITASFDRVSATLSVPFAPLAGPIVVQFRDFEGYAPNVVPGAPVVGAVLLASPAPVGGISVTLSSSDTAAVAFEKSSTVLIPQGQSSGYFTLDSLVPASVPEETVTITASSSLGSARGAVTVGTYVCPPPAKGCAKGASWDQPSCSCVPACSGTRCM
jgi:hypothetical protein